MHMKYCDHIRIFAVFLDAYWDPTQCTCIIRLHPDILRLEGLSKLTDKLIGKGFQVLTGNLLQIFRAT